MSGSSGSPVTTQTQTRDPWSGAQPYLSSMYSTAENYQQNQVGYQPYAGPTVAAIDPLLGQGLARQQDLGTFFADSAQNPGWQNLGFAENLVGLQGLLPGQTQAIGGLGQAANLYGQLYSQNIGAANPYLDAAIADQNRLAAERVQSSMSGAGRYGSGQYADVMARAQAEVADPLLAQDYMQRQQLAQGAIGGLADTQRQIAGIYGQGLQQAGQFMQAEPGFMQQLYAPGQTLTDIGQYYQGRTQQDLQAQIALYNAQQAYPWQQLERQAAIMAGAGQLGGSQVTAQTPLQAPLAQRLLGGALVGGGLGSAIPGLGTGLGAGLGALTGGFL